MKFMQKYIHVARILKPILTQEAAELISEEYTKLRSQESQGDNVARTQPVTARTLETMIRLSTAHAKSRLSKNVELQDAEAAVELIQFAYFKKVLAKEKKRRHKGGEEGESESEEEVTETGDATTATKRNKSPRKKLRKRVSGEGDEYDPYDFEEDETASEGENPSLKERRVARTKTPDSEPMEEMESATSGRETVAISEDRMKTFRTSLFNLFKAEHAQASTMDKVLAHVEKEHPGAFSTDEIHSALDTMMEANQVMVSDNAVFLI